MIDFLWWQVLFGLILIPVLSVHCELTRKKIDWVGYREPSRIPLWLFLASLASLTIGTARPIHSVTLPISEVTVILAIDVSGSMEDGDIPPSRLDAAKQASKRFIEKLDSRIGVVAFAETVAVVQQPTFDKDSSIKAINRLETLGGTAIGDAILQSLELLNGNAAIVLLTDGRSNTGIHPKATLDYTKHLGVRIFTVGIGTQDPNMGSSGNLDEETLALVAKETGGIYQKVGTNEEIIGALNRLIPRLTVETKTTEMTFLFAGIGAMLMIASVGMAAWNG
jgi:Ca-activated chloride channel family protein